MSEIQRYGPESFKDALGFRHESACVKSQSGEYVLHAAHIAEVKRLQAALAAMTVDRNLWQDDHEGDCPHAAGAELLIEQMRVLREALIELRAWCGPGTARSNGARCETWHDADAQVDAALAQTEPRP